MVSEFLLISGLAGLIGSTVFLALVIAGAVRYRRATDLAANTSASLPPVSLLKPLCGLEPNLEANLESFFRQDYPQFEIIFGARHGDDPALQLVRTLARRHPEVKIR